MTNPAFMTTLQQIRDCHPCADGWQKLLGTLGKTKADDEPLSLLTILDSNGFDDALWCARAIKGHDRDFRLFTVWAARQVQHLMTDERSVSALDVAERHANCEASDHELSAAWSAAESAARSAESAACFARFAARFAARSAAESAARSAESAACFARFAAWSAAWFAARFAESAARSAAWSAAESAARFAQENRLRQMIADCGWFGSTAPDQKP